MIVAGMGRLPFGLVGALSILTIFVKESPVIVKTFHRVAFHVDL